jgi:hypothetical protein
MQNARMSIPRQHNCDALHTHALPPFLGVGERAVCPSLPPIGPNPARPGRRRIADRKHAPEAANPLTKPGRYSWLS